MSCFTSQPSNTSSIHAAPTVLSLQRHAHDASDLASLVTSALSDTKHMQVVGGKLEEWHEEIKALKKRHEETDELPTKYDMEYLIDLIGAIFFFLKISHVHFYWEDDLYTKHGSFGRTRMTKHPDKPEDQLWIEIDDLHMKGETPDHFTHIISSLLHECVHAFLDSYSCDRYCDADTCRVKKVAVSGGTGHGSAFVRILTHVEACANTCMDDRLRLGVENSMRHERDETGVVLDEADIRLCHPQYQERLRKVVRKMTGRM